MKIIVIIQARLTSTRLPGKVLKQLGDSTVIKNIVERASRAKFPDKIVVAISREKTDDPLYQYCMDNGIDCYRGSLNNVLERFFYCANSYDADIIVRLTGDNALIDSNIIDAGIRYLMCNEKNEYIKYRDGLPLGMSVEVFLLRALKKAYELASSKEEREHVTPRMYSDSKTFSWSMASGVGKEDFSSLRWTIDTVDDYKLVSEIYEFFGNNLFRYEDILHAYKEHPEWVEINKHVIQNVIDRKTFEKM